MQTECSAELSVFGRVEGRPVVAAFDGGAVTSDAGGLLLGAADRSLGLVRRLSGCFRDARNPRFIEHSVATLIGQRVFGIALGYEDLNDHDELRHDPVMAVLAGKLKARREDCAPAAGKPTLNRLELSREIATRYHKISHEPVAIEALFVDLFLEAHGAPPRQIVLDLDATDDRLHGHQEGRFFHGYYDCYCYLPLYVFCGRHLLAAKLRPSNIDGSAGAVEEAARIVARYGRATSASSRTWGLAQHQRIAALGRTADRHDRNLLHRRCIDHGHRIERRVRDEELFAVRRERNPVRYGADRRLPRFLAHRQRDITQEPQVWQRIGEHRVVDDAIDPQALAVRCDSDAVTRRCLVSVAFFRSERQVRQPDPFHLLSCDEIHDRNAVKLRELYEDPVGRAIGVRLDGHRPHTRLKAHSPGGLISGQIEHRDHVVGDGAGDSIFAVRGYVDVVELPTDWNALV